MRLGGVSAFAFLLALTIAHRVSSSEDIYWEGDLEENEFLEVKENGGHFSRFKRGLFDSWGIFGSASTTTTQTPPPAPLYQNGDDDVDDNLITEGSGYADLAENYGKEKTLRVTFVVVEPYHHQYSSRDSPQFQNFSRSLSDAVNLVLEKLPGTQRASLVRIQSSSLEEFSCKVTLDIVTSGYENTDVIADTLKEHIREKKSLGNITVDVTEFNAKVVDPETIDLCAADELNCGDGSCVSGSARCDGNYDCADGADEDQCPFDPARVPSQGEIDMPGGDNDNLDTNDNDINSNFDQNAGNDLENVETATDRIEDNYQCAPEEFQCDGTRCLPQAYVCNGRNDCDDGTDETEPICNVVPGSKQCNPGDFRCGNENGAKCIEANKRCDKIVDCPTGEDEVGCATDLPSCPADSFTCPGNQGQCATRCNDYPECPGGEDELDCKECSEYCDGHCVEDNKICDGIPDCQDNSDEANCPTCDGPDDFRCQNKQCVKAGFRCNGLQDCDDGSDELDCDKLLNPVITENVCTSDQFKCSSGYCVSGEKLCDGTDDCGDGSDELDCAPSYVTTTYRPPYGTSSRPSRPETDRPFYPTQSPTPSKLLLKTYPKEQTIRFVGGDVVFQCRDEGLLRAPVRWVRQDGRPLPPGTQDRNGRLEMPKVSTRDSGAYICQAPAYLSYPDSQVTVYLNVENSPPPPASVFTCKPYEATCRNGECIPKSAVCDKRYDCSDRSDEDECGEVCEPNAFRCNNKKCILKTWLCDSEDDCGDGSDERDCGTSAPGDPCSPIEFQCKSGQCIPKSFHCDVQVDCMDGSDEIGCAPVYITSPPNPSNVHLNPGDTLILRCSAAGNPTPLISWRLNWGHVPEQCTSTSELGDGVLTCPNMQPGNSGAYSCEAINNKGTNFAYPDAIVIVNRTQDVCPRGFFNSEALTESECIRCFCFGESTQCHSADLFTFNMPTPLGQGGTRLLGINLDYTGRVSIDSQTILSQYVYQPLRNGATIMKLDSYETRPSLSKPYLAIPESYNGNQLKSYGGVIKYTLSPHLTYGYDNQAPDIIIIGKYETLSFNNRNNNGGGAIEARLVPENWQKASSSGPIQATREDIMMALDNIEHILLRADKNNAGVNITDFVMESADHINMGLGAASLVEQCTCPPGYEGLSCQKCSEGFVREENGRWLGHCVPERKPCPPGTYGDPSSGYACRACPCPLTVRSNQFATTCSLGPSGVVCDCDTGYEGNNCERCAPGYEGNPLVLGDYCHPVQPSQCNTAGTASIAPGDQCVCKDNVQGPYCDQCTSDSYHLAEDNSEGCVRCFCTGVSQECTSSSLRRKKTSVTFNVPQIVDDVHVYSSAQSSRFGVVDYRTPVQSDLKAVLNQGAVSIYANNNVPSVYYWSLPASFSGDKVTAYGGHLSYTLKNVPIGETKNGDADVQLISDNRLTFHYFTDAVPFSDGYLNVTIPLLEKGWRRADGNEVIREHLLLALADVKTILVKATYSTNLHMASLVSASIETADQSGYGAIASEVEQCLCPPEYKGTSCEDCAPGFSRSGSGLYLELCKPCECNGHSTMCHPETGECYSCGDNTAGPNCEQCKPGYERNPYNDCVPSAPPPDYCDCDPRGVQECRERQCVCKHEVEGSRCDQCRQGTFGLDASNPDGCLPCYCSGVTSDCHEATHYSRIPIPVPIIGDNYGGFRLMSLNDDVVLNEAYVPAANESELTYVFSGRYNQDLYWSIPTLPGDRISSYGGKLTFTLIFRSEGYPGSVSSDHNVILVGAHDSVFWNNPEQIRPNEPTVVSVSIRETDWYVQSTNKPASRYDLLEVLKDVKRVLVKATLTPDTYSTSIADVSMDSAESYVPGSPEAVGVEVCMCPEGHTGNSCQDCSYGYYHDEQGYCRKCNCNGFPCVLARDGQVSCQCSQERDGPSCPNQEIPTPPPKTVTVTAVNTSKITIKEVGESVHFVCHAESKIYNGLLPLTWTKSEGELPQGRHQIDNTGLTLTNLQVSDTGKYVCSAQDGVSSDEQYFILQVPRSTMTFPQVTLQPPDQEYEVGQRIELKCSATGIPTPTISFQRASNLPIPESASFVEESSSVRVLIIDYAQEEDSGEYTCSAYNSVGQKSASALITVRPRSNRSPKLTLSTQAVSVNEGGSTSVVCTGSQEIPSGSIFWTRQDGSELSENVRVDGGVLYIYDAQLADQGVYTCQTTANNASPISVTVFVISDVPRPEATVEVSVDSLTIPTGGTGTIDCYSKGEPRPIIIWTKNEGSFSSYTSQRDNTLIINNAQESDGGYYKCEGQVNNEPVASTYVAVIIERRDKPTLSIWPDRDNEARIGSEYQFQCSVTGYPDPVVTWSRVDGRPLTYSTEILEGNVLRFKKVDVNDEGEYMCNAENIAGSANITASLKVTSEPQITITPDSYIQARPGDQVTVECRADGYPQPSVSIKTSDGREVVRASLGIAVLRLPSVTFDDQKEYLCVADNGVAVDTRQIFVYVERGDIGSGNGEDYYTTPPNPPAENQVAIEGNDVILGCALPAKDLEWRRDDAPIGNNVYFDNRQFIIRNVSKRDEGIYVCSSASLGSSSPLRLVVRSPPRITLSTTRKSARPGESPVITCEAEGDYIQLILWLPVNRSMPDRAEVRGGELTFRNIQFEDAGFYKCVASNDVTNSSLTVQVVVDDTGPGVLEQLVSLPQTALRPYNVGEDVMITCRATSPRTTVQWSKLGTSEYVDTRDFGDGSMLSIINVQSTDTGLYRCTGRDDRGRYSYLDFNLEVIQQGDVEGEIMEYTARLLQSIDLPCNHGIPGPVTYQWESDTMPLRADLITYEQTLRLGQVTEADAGIYVCRVSGPEGSAEAKAILRVSGVVPRFEGHEWLTLPPLKDSYQQFNIEVSFKPTDGNGLILYNSENPDKTGYFIAFQLVEGVPQLVLQTDEIIIVDGDRPLQLNEWHTARINRVGSKISMTIDNIGPFTKELTNAWSVLDLRQPLYIGGVPDTEQLPGQLAGADGFMGCVGMLILGKEETNIMKNSTDSFNVKDCDSCSPDPCLNNGVCQDVPNEQGYTCLCHSGFAGVHCDRVGEGCRPGLCGIGKCTDTSEGYKCTCPITTTGRNCEQEQVIEYPAFRGSAFLAIKPPQNKRFLRMSLKIKATAPVVDGIIMYSAESASGRGGFMSLAVKDRHLEYRYDVSDGRGPVILTSQRELVANEWVEAYLNRMGSRLSLKTNNGREETVEGTLASPDKLPILDTPLFVGGVDDSITLNENTGVSGGFYGCIIDIKEYGNKVNLVNSSIISANVQECGTYDRGDIPESDNICRYCRNGGYCQADSSYCICPEGYSGTYCEQRTTNQCTVNSCYNGGTCRPDSSRLSFTCDCPLGYTGSQCHIDVELLQSVGFSGNGYLELPASQIRYNEPEPAVIALAFNTRDDGILIYQEETGGVDFLLLRVENGFITAEWDLGSGTNTLVVDRIDVRDGRRHSVISKLFEDTTLSLTVDSDMYNATSVGFSPTMHADSNIYLGGMPDRLNVRSYPGFVGCIEQVEFMSNSRSLSLGTVAVAARNAHKCSDEP